MDNVLVFNVGQTSVDTITPRLADGSPSGGIVSNVGFSFTDTTVSIVINADNTLTMTGVSASNGPVAGAVTCSVTDTDGVVSQWTQGFTVETLGPPPAQLTQSVANVFSTPV